MHVANEFLSWCMTLIVHTKETISIFQYQFSIQFKYFPFHWECLVQLSVELNIFKQISQMLDCINPHFGQCCVEKFTFIVCTVNTSFHSISYLSLFRFFFNGMSSPVTISCLTLNQFNCFMWQKKINFFQFSHANRAKMSIERVMFSLKIWFHYFYLYLLLTRSESIVKKRSHSVITINLLRYR